MSATGQCSTESTARVGNCVRGLARGQGWHGSCQCSDNEGGDQGKRHMVATETFDTMYVHDRIYIILVCALHPLPTPSDENYMFIHRKISYLEVR